MPGKVKVKIIAGKNLPVMDRSSDTTDAYVEIKLGSTTYKTDVCRKSLNPQWNSDWYRFEVDDSELQDEPLQLRLMDHDTYSANDAIGKVYLDLNPLLLPSAAIVPKFGWGGDSTNNSEHVTNSVLSGWFPVYDTMHGIRGEVNVIVKVELFSDFNRFRQSSCGVQFFCSAVIPHGYCVQMYHGFVEELIVNDDPEYQWIDKIRTPRASNEARQTLFFKLAGELQRKIGVKALELGGNAVVGYSQCFDLEGELGIVVRGTGTAVTLVKLRDAPPAPIIDTTNEERAQNYLQFLRQYNNFYLNRGNFNKPLPPFPYHIASTHFLNTSENISDYNLKAKRNLTRHLSYGDFTAPSKSPQPPCRPAVENVHHASSLQTLLRQEDLRGNPGSGISQRLKNFKYSSQNILSKKMTALKAKLSDSGMLEEDDADSTLSTYPSRLSLLEGTKKTSLLYQRSTSDSSAMAELLVRSLIHSSLDCIAETHDNPAASTSKVELEPNTTRGSNNTITSINEPVNLLSKSASEPQLLEPNLLLSMDLSSSNGGSSSESSSSDEDESISDVQDETNVEYDTISNIIKSIIHSPKGPVDTSSIISGNEELSNWPYLENETKDVEYQIDTTSTNDVPPLAEFESFAIEQNSPVQFSIWDEETYSNIVDTDDVSDSCLEKVTECETSLPESSEPKSIIPSITMSESTVNSQKLVQTAMQTILFDKLKLVGTYTPPSSPSLANKDKNVFNFEESIASSKDHKQKQSFFPQFANILESIRRSPKTVQESSREENISTTITAGVSSHDSTSNQKPNVLEKSPDEDIVKHQSDFITVDKQEVTMEQIDFPFRTNAESFTEEPITTYPAPVPETPYLISSNCDKKFKFNASAPTSCLTAIPDNLPVNSELDRASNNMHASLAHSLRTVGSPGTEPARYDHGHQRTESVGTKISQSPARFHPIPFMHRRSSDSDLSITPKGNSLTGSDKSGGLASGYFPRMGALLRPTIPQDNFDMLEYPFITMSKYPPGFIIYIGGVVSARSVKLLERITNLEEPESRDTWWTELRMEIRSHARALNCNAVLAYCEASSICDDVCVLSASGTAAVIGFQYTGEIGDSIGGLPLIPKSYYGNKDLMATSLDRNDFERDKILQKPDSVLLSNIGINSKPLPESPENETQPAFNSLSPCTVCHLPYTGNAVPLRTITLKCAVCRIGKVPEILLATIELPEGIPILGRGCFIQAYVCRQLKDLRSESNAKDISDGLPFLEYELHRILVNKIRIKGMNAVFGLKVRISIGTKMLVGIATGTGVFLLPLPPPPLPKLVSVRSTDEKQLAEMQQLLSDTVETNKEIYQLKTSDESQNIRMSPDNEHHSEDEQPFLDLSSENRDCCILEVDDPEDMEIMNLLMEPRPPDGFHVVNTELVPGLEEMEIVKNLQMFTQIWRSKIYPPYNFGRHVHKLLQSVYFKLRRMIPCALCDLKFRVDLPEADEIQLTVLGMALGLCEPQKLPKYKRKNMHMSLKDCIGKNDEDMIFNLEEDQVVESSTVSNQCGTNFLNVQTAKHRAKSPHRSKVPTSKQQVQVRERHGIDITPLSYIPGGKIERYLGNLNFFFIRETTSIREEGGLSGFIHSFITEVLAIVRAHIAALGGNAMVAYYMTECVLSHNLHKNQGQCLINVGGDVVFVSYFTEE